MKLSIAWLFDHIAASFTDYDIADLVNKLTLTTAEVEGVERITVDVSLFTLARVIDIQKDHIVATSGQLETDISLPFRTDVVEGAVYMLKRENDVWRWATLFDFHCSKEGLLPAIDCSQKEFEGEWQKEFEVEDYIIEVDNSSITHRPDLWSHRGFARELAAIIGVPMTSREQFFANHPIQEHEQFASPTTGNPFGLEIKDAKRCKRFAGMYIANVGQYASWLWMLHRLCRVDAKPINGIVDATNYVMFDIGQPLHAFDADTIPSKQLIPRTAKEGEPLLLLDDQTIELSDEDLVISNGVKPIALAGIMGGKATEVTSKTRSIMVEAATFGAVSIRKTAQRHKLRTESSMRFEKSLDTHLNVKGLQRFVKLLEQQQVPLTASSDIVSLGKLAPSISLSMTHKAIEAMLGVAVPSEQVIQILTAIAFTVTATTENGTIVYKIGVPSFRSTKNDFGQQDIVEEVGRFYGFSKIIPELPAFQVRPTDLTPIQRRRAIKYYVATNFRAHEVKKYPVFDEQFLARLGWEPEDAVNIKNPLSDNWRRMITSLVPHLFGCIADNVADNHQLRFFEWGRQWHLDEDNKIHERKMLAGIMFDQRYPIDFYAAKDTLEDLCRILGFQVTWQKIKPTLPWYHPYMTAQLNYEHYGIGVMGIAHPGMLAKVAEGHALIFELDGDFLLTSEPKPKQYVPVSPYQASSRDISFFVPLSVTVAQLEAAIASADSRIFDVSLVDYYQRKEWADKRSLTMRFFVRDREKTLAKDEIDLMYDAVAQQIIKLGATVR